MNKILLFASLIACTALHAQTGGRTLALQGVYHQGSVILRWASGSPVVWDLIRANGVMLTRQESKDSLVLNMNGGIPIRVWDGERWREKARSLPAAAQVATLLRDDEKERERLTEYAQADLAQNKLTGLLLMAEFNLEIAEGLALASVDRDVLPKNIYRYLVAVTDPVHGDTLRAECFVNTGEETPLLPVMGLQTESGDGYNDLRWNRLPVHSGYFIERRMRASGEWLRLNPVPRIYADNYPGMWLYRDSVRNGENCEYRVRGIDPFGRVSEPSSAVSASGRDRTPPAPPHDVRWKKQDKGVLVSWKNPPGDPDLAGYALLRSRNPNDTYEPVHRELLKPGTGSYFDEVPGAGTYFYRLVASDSSGNLSPMSVRTMAVIDDTIPAGPPEGLVATADTGGVITVRWRHVQEGDVAGYRVYRMIRGGREAEFLPLTPGILIDTVMTDTLMASVRDRFVYRVRSVDFAGNYSRPSSETAVRFPDVTAPVAPAIKEYSVRDRKVLLRFVSASTDVAQYEIRRISVSSSEKELSARIRREEWTDSTARHGIEYRYDVIAIDSSGNKSVPSKTVYAKPFWKMEIPRPQAPGVRLEGDNRHVIVTWTYPEPDGYSAVVFRRAGTGGFVQASPVLKSTRFAEAVPGPGEYQYALTFYLAGMGASEMGASTSVNAK